MVVSKRGSSRLNRVYVKLGDTLPPCIYNKKNMQMRKVLLIHISSIGCCNPLVIMLNNGNFGFPYSLLPRFPPCSLVPRFPLPRFPPLHFCYSRVFSRPSRAFITRPLTQRLKFNDFTNLDEPEWTSLPNCHKIGQRVDELLTIQHNFLACVSRRGK